MALNIMMVVLETIHSIGQFYCPWISFQESNGNKYLLLGLKLYIRHKVLDYLYYTQMSKESRISLFFSRTVYFP
jgi:hypothetical protein